ncbi:unnamed protein product [Alopecurus aequalis]
MPPPPLPDELLEEIFLRLPPDEPACLVRASLASKLCHDLLTSARFRSRYREHHGAPPMLGFLNSTPWESMDMGQEERGPAVPPFVSTTKGFRARVPDDGWGYRDYTAWDCRHGRVLLGENNALVEETRKLAVWDPMTGRRWELQEPEVVDGYGFCAAAVLCAISGCDHLACHDGPFRVVHFSLHKVAGDEFVAEASTCDFSKHCLSLLDFHRTEWSDPCPGVSIDGDGYIEPRPPVLVDGALHFLLAHDGYGPVPYVQILKYNLSSNCLSLIEAPNAGADMAVVSVLMATEDGNLGFAHLEKFTLFIWSRHMGSDRVAAWTRHRVIDLKNLLPIQNPQKDVSLLGSVEGNDIVFVETDLGIYKIDLKTLRQLKISNGEYLVSLIPYTSFYLP